MRFAFTSLMRIDRRLGSRKFTSRKLGLKWLLDRTTVISVAKISLATERVNRTTVIMKAEGFHAARASCS
jgi:hypothetical protein